MFGKFSNTWELMGHSWSILKQDKELLVFQLLSGICCLLVTASFLVLAVQGDSLAPPPNDVPPIEQVAYYGGLFLFYFVNYFLITFFNSAIVACAAIRLDGGDPTIGDGFREAFSRIHLIFGWALLSATIGMALRLIAERSGKIGRFIVSLLGAAWSVVTFLVIPILVIEKKSPVAAMKESASLLRKTWGQQLLSNFSYGGIFFLLGLIPVGLVGLGIYLIASTGNPVGYVLVGVGIIVVILLSLIQSTLQCIFQTSLYYYASDRQISGVRAFPVELMDQAFYSKS